MRPLEPGSWVGEFRVDSLIRAGARGSLFRAEQPELGRMVALHVAAAPAGSEEAARFLRLAGALAEVDHPHVLPVYEVGERDGLAFAAVRDAPGPRLEEVLRDGPLAADRAAQVTSELGAALEALERAGAPVGLLAPANVVLSADGAYLAPLDPGADGDRREEASSSVALARLLATMVTGEAEAPSERVPLSLRPVITRATTQPGGYRSPREFTAAVSAAVKEPGPGGRGGRRLGGTLLAVGAVAVAVIVVAVLVAGGEEQQQTRGAPSAPADAPAGRVAATVPLRGQPLSLAEGDGALWMALADGTVVRVDPRANQVVGAPIRFARPDKDSSLTVRAGAGAVFALDGNAGTVTRIDPRRGRVTRRVRLGGQLHTGAVSDGVVWVTLSRGRKNELVRLDAGTLRPIGRRYPVGISPVDVEASDGTVWVTGLGDGKITRVRPAMNEVKQVFPTAAPGNATLHNGVLWIPNPFEGLIAKVNATTLRPSTDVVRTGHPYAATATRDAVWVVANLRLDDPGTSPGRLYRVDARTGRLAGRPVDLDRPIGQPVASEGALWVNSAGKRALLKIVPTVPAPRPGPPPPQSRRLRGAPLRPGRWEGDRFTAPFNVEVREPGWINFTYERQRHALFRVENGRGLELTAPTQLFTPAGGVKALRSPSQVLRWLAEHPQLNVTPPRRTLVGGVPATTVDVDVDTRRIRDYPPFCQRPCALSFAGSEGITWTVEAGKPLRMHVLRRGSSTIVVMEDALSLDRTTPLLRTVRFAEPR